MKFKELAGLVLTAAILACAAAPAFANPGERLNLVHDLVELAGVARAQRAPLMIVFTQVSCIHCEIAKRDYLVPMSRSTEFNGKVIIREVDVDSRANIRDFSGKPVSQKDFSLRYRVRSVPTVVVMDDAGRPVASPIVGLLADDFYQLYLQQAIDEGRTKMRAAHNK